LLAREIVRTGSFFPPDWNYVNDFMIVFPHVFILPFVGLINNLFLLHAIGIASSAAILVLVLWLFVSKTGFRADVFCLSAALILSGPSMLLAEFIFGQGAYLFILASTLMVNLCTYKLYESLAAAQAGRSMIFYGVALFSMVAANVTSGLRGVLTLVLPVAAALLAYAFLDRVALRRPTHLVASLVPLGTLTLATITGAAGYLYLTATRTLMRDSSAAYAPFSKILKNLQTFLEGFLACTGSLPDPGRDPLSLYGVITAYRRRVFLIRAIRPCFSLFQ
jgi:hypothetical protein